MPNVPTPKKEPIAEPKQVEPPAPTDVPTAVKATSSDLDAAAKKEIDVSFTGSLLINEFQKLSTVQQSERPPPTDSVPTAVNATPSDVDVARELQAQLDASS